MRRPQGMSGLGAVTRAVRSLFFGLRSAKIAMATFASPCYLVTGSPLISSIFWPALSFNSLALSESTHVARGRTWDALRVSDLEEEGRAEKLARQSATTAGERGTIEIPNVSSSTAKCTPLRS
jgi:hypothetical protein